MAIVPSLSGGCVQQEAAQKAVPQKETSAPPRITKAYADVNGLKMYYEIHGGDSGSPAGGTASPAGGSGNRPLLLLHGGGSTIETTFAKVLPALAARHRVIAPEQQGHGHTADIDRPFSFEQMADDTAALLRSLGVAQADVLGFSNGGSVAMQLAIRHPALVRKAIVASSFYKGEGIPAPIRESFKRPVSPKDMPPTLRDAYQRASPHPDKLQTQIDKLMRMLNTFEDWKASDLQGIRAPVLFMTGDTDVATPEHTVEMFRLVPHAQLAIFPGTPHGAYLGEATSPACRGCPDSAIAMIEAFLDAPMPAPAPATAAGQ